MSKKSSAFSCQFISQLVGAGKVIVIAPDLSEMAGAYAKVMTVQVVFID
jgi:hypothetical protein